MQGHRSLVLLSLESDLELSDLVLQKFLEEFAELIKVDFTRLVLLEKSEDVVVDAIKRGVNLSYHLVSFQEKSHEIFNLNRLDSTLVVCVDGIVDVLRHFSELIDVDQDISQVLDGFLVVHSDVF